MFYYKKDIFKNIYMNIYELNVYDNNCIGCQKKKKKMTVVCQVIYSLS